MSWLTSSSLPRACGHRIPRPFILLGAVLACACSSSETVAGPSSAPTTAPAPPGPVQRGQLHAWPETAAHLVLHLESDVASVELGPGRPSGIDAFWSIASTRGVGSGFFYSDVFRPERETRVAHAVSVRRVQDIRDARAFDYSSTSVGPVPAGDIVLVHHLPTARYLAIVVDAIEAVDPRAAGAGPFAFADVTWYLAAPDGVDFSLAP